MAADGVDPAAGEAAAGAVEPARAGPPDARPVQPRLSGGR